jgi:hypothetical protein
MPHSIEDPDVISYFLRTMIILEKLVCEERSAISKQHGIQHELAFNIGGKGTPKQKHSDNSHPFAYPAPAMSVIWM